MVPVQFTEPEKVKVRHHLGFPAVMQSSTFSLGAPASLEVQFIVEGALQRMPGTSCELVRDLLAKLDAIEAQLAENTENLAVVKIGSIELNEKEFEQVQQRYTYWRGALANAFGIVGNPFDKRPGLGGGGGINFGVRG